MHLITGGCTGFRHPCLFRRLDRLPPQRTRPAFRQFSRPGEGFFRFFSAADSDGRSQRFYNADRSQGSLRLLFAVNPTLQDLEVPLRRPPPCGWQQLADHVRFFRTAAAKQRGLWRETVLFLPWAAGYGWSNRSAPSLPVSFQIVGACLPFDGFDRLTAGRVQGPEPFRQAQAPGVSRAGDHLTVRSSSLIACKQAAYNWMILTRPAMCTPRIALAKAGALLLIHPFGGPAAACYLNQHTTSTIRNGENHGS